jgi:tetratricopeptide (TPR) repeat protein
MPIQKNCLTTILTLIYPFATPHILSAATLDSSKFLSLSQTTVIHPSSANSLDKVQQENAFDVLSQAFQIAQSFEDNQLKAKALIDIASGYVALGEKERASELLFQALKVSQLFQINQSNFASNYYDSKSDLLLDLAIGYAALGKKEKASEVLSQALQEAPAIIVDRLRLFSLSNIAVEYAALGQKEKAAEVFSQALQSIQLFKDNGNDLEALGIIEALGIVASKASKLGQFDQARKAAQTALNLAQAIKKDVSKVDALTDTASYYIAAGDKEKASEILSQTLQVAQSKELDEPLRADALIKISTGYLAAGYKEKAFEVLHKVFQIPKKLYLSNQELEPLAEAYAAVEQYDQVLLVSATMDSETVASVLSAVSRKLASMGQYERAVNLAQAIKSDEYKNFALLGVVRKAAEAGYYEQALKVAQTLQSDSDKTYELLRVVREAAEAGHYEQALKVAQTLQSDSDKTYALARIAWHYAATGRYDQALKLAETLQSDTKVEIVANIADYYAAGGQYEQALKLVQTMDNAHKANALVSIANYFAVAGQKQRASELLTQAFQIAQSLPVDNQPRLTEIAIGFAAVGQYDQALKLASTIESSQDSEEEVTLVLTGIAAHYGAAGQRENALKVFTKALKFNKIAASSYRCHADFVQPMLSEIVNRYVAGGQYDQSLQISQISKDESFKLKLLNEVILKYVEDKKKESREIMLASTPRGGCGV